MLKKLYKLGINRKYLYVLLTVIVFLTMFEVSLQYGIQQAVDIALGNIKNKSLLGIAIFLISINIIYMMSLYYEEVYKAKFEEDIALKLKSKGLRWFMNQPLLDIEKQPKGEVFQMLDVDCNNIAGSVTNNYLELLKLFLQITACLTFVLIFSKEIFIVLLLIMPPIYFFNKKYSKIFAESNKNAVEKEQKYKTLLQQIFANMDILKIHNVSDNVKNKVDTTFSEKFKHLKSQYTAHSYMINFTLTFMNLSRVVILVIGIYLVAKEKLTYGELIGVWSISNQIVWYFFDLPDKLADYKVRDVSFKRIEKFFVDTPITETKNCSNYLDGDLVLNSISFKYPNSDITILDNFSHRFKNKEITYIIGESGVGKSTLLKLILGLYNENMSEIYLEHNKDKLLDVQNHIAYVSQSNFLLEQSIFENLSLNSETITTDKVFEILKNVNLFEEVSKLPKGLDSIIGTDVTFSVGQNQRLCIARALLTNSSFIVLDEPYASLDDENTQQLMSLFIKISKERGLIVVSHDTKSKDIADCIINLEKGGVYNVH